MNTPTHSRDHYRDSQLRELAMLLSPALRVATPINTTLHGPPGTGKTTCVRQIFTEIEECTPRVVTVLVNCESVRTPFRVFATIFRRLFGH
ncbi:AAA family ATPase [Methanogenium sp. MK-MG]|uniref:AAA family ATPase n=1 Tax=Methanogenium sp. MK-MG TaxID=2599926 RepID=UPI0013E9BD08|nr:AAA family ATPase [Methanogenium sp. MK-MG]